MATTDTQTSTERISTDDLFAVLSSTRRRQALEELHRHGRLTLGELADKVSVREYGKPLDDISSQERKTVYISLYQSHVPKFEMYGIIRETDGGYELTNAADEVLWYIQNGPRAF